MEGEESNMTMRIDVREERITEVTLRLDLTGFIKLSEALDIACGAIAEVNAGDTKPMHTNALHCLSEVREALGGE